MFRSKERAIARDKIDSQLEYERSLERTACGVCGVMGFLLGMAFALAIGALSFWIAVH